MRMIIMIDNASGARYNTKFLHLRPWMNHYERKQLRKRSDTIVYVKDITKRILTADSFLISQPSGQLPASISMKVYSPTSVELALGDARGGDDRIPKFSGTTENTIQKQT